MERLCGLWCGRATWLERQSRDAQRSIYSVNTSACMIRERERAREPKTPCHCHIPQQGGPLKIARLVTTAQHSTALSSSMFSFSLFLFCYLSFTRSRLPCSVAWCSLDPVAWLVVHSREWRSVAKRCLTPSICGSARAGSRSISPFFLCFSSRRLFFLPRSFLHLLALHCMCHVPGSNDREKHTKGVGPDGERGKRALQICKVDVPFFQKGHATYAEWNNTNHLCKRSVTGDVMVNYSISKC